MRKWRFDIIKRAGGVTLGILCLLLLAACGKRQVEEVHITIPGMEGEQKLYYLSDLHLIVEDDEVAEDQKELVHDRVKDFANKGTTSADAWPDWVEYLNSSDADYIVFGGDMVDFASRENVSQLGEGLAKLVKPWMYVRADHDSEPFYLAGVERAECVTFQNEIAPNDEVMVQEFADYYIVGWNNSTSQMTEQALEQMKEVFAVGKPIILLTHVPVAPLVTDSLAEESKKVWGDRALIWGEGCYHYPDAVTKEFLQMIYDENTPVKEILCGHLHFSWDGNVTERVHQHVFGPAFEGNVGIITITGE